MSIRWIDRLVASRHHLGGSLLRIGLSHRRDDPIDLGAVRDLLIIRNDEIGDFILTSAFLRELRPVFPKARIVLVASPACRGLAARCPYVDEVLEFDGLARVPGLSQMAGALRARDFARKHFAARAFDLAIVPRWDVDAYGASALAYFGGARWRVAYSERVNANKAMRNCGFDALFTHVIDDRELRHEAERSLAFIPFLGGEIRGTLTECWTSAADDAFADRALARLPTHSLRVAVAPGAGAPRRRWPPERFAEVLHRLRRDHSVAVVLLGGPDERPLGNVLAAEIGDGVTNLIGETTLPQAAALLRRCDFFVGNDSGPMHLAAAAGIPVVMVSCHPCDANPAGSQSPERFRPWTEAAETVRPRQFLPPCVDQCTALAPHCILDVKTEEVAAAALRLLASSQPWARQEMTGVGS